MILYAPHLGKGYGKQALQLLCEAARENGLREFFDELALDNPAVVLFSQCGFTEMQRTEETVLVKKDLKN